MPVVLKTVRGRFCLLVAVLALAPPLAAAAPAQGALRLGIGDDTAATFSDPRFAWLGVRSARLVVPWDTANHRDELAAARAWLTAARAHRVTPLVSFDHAAGRAARRKPSVANYSGAVLRFRRQFPWVTEYGAWDEANHVTEPTARDPRLAADFFNAIMRQCPHCTVVAADVLDGPNMRSWTTRFKRYAHHPRIWGMHNYFDLNHGGDRNTAILLSLVPGQIWLTETGGLIWRYDISSRHFVIRGERRATHAAQHLFGLARLSRRITRIYYYHWRIAYTLGYARKHPGKVTWDSGLFRPDCSARPALNVIARALHRSTAHMPRAVRDHQGDCIARTRRPAVVSPPLVSPLPGANPSPNP